MVGFYSHLDTFIYEKKAQGLSQATLNSYYFTVDKFLKYCNGEKPSKALFYGFLNSIDVRGETKKHYGRETRVFLYWLMEEGLIDRFKVVLPKGQEPIFRVPPKEQVEELCRKKGNNYTEERMYVICNLVVCTGIRARSIINLRVDDISLEKQQMLLRETKNKHISVIPLNDDITMILRKYIRKWDLSEWLFVTQNGKQMTSEGLSSSYERYAIRCGCCQHGIHSLRHYMITEAVRQGISPYTISKIAGHSDISITMKYVQYVNEDLRNEINGFNPLKF